MTTAMEELVVTVTPRNRANFRRLKTNSIQSVKRWEKENELLYAMMEDESEWLAKLFPDVVISPEFFFYALEDGSLLCRLANYIQEKAELYSQKHNVPVPGKKFRFHTMSKCGREIKLFRSRENVQQFLIWCRSHGLPEAILFESNDVVQVDDYREGCRGVIICLMEIVRRTAKFDLDELPQLIQMEKEIEEDEAHSDTELSNEQGQVLDVEKINMTEIDNLEVHADQPEIQSPSSLDSDSGVDSVFDQDEGDNTASRLTEFSHEETEKTEKTTTCTVTVRKQTSSPKPKDHKSSPKKGKELPSLLESTGPKSELDKQVCKIAQDYNIKVVHRLKEGKYIILGRVMFVRMLNDHMLVRIGGGWDTLEHYLMTHAPSKEALEAPSTPSSQAITSPRNSISAASGVRTSLFERVKRKEQVGIVIRDSAVYSSQGSLNQQLGAASSPRIKGKRESLKDEKDITDAIRKISTSVSQNLAERPVSFTNKTFHQLKSRFDKGIFGAARRTSSPDLTLKGDKIRRRLSDTPRMADVATTLAFDGEQVPVANNNDTESKQPENAEEQDVGKAVAPTGDLLGDASLQRDISTPENIFSDETDSGVPVGDLLSMETSNQPHLNGDSLDGQVNGVANVVDVSSFDPFAAAPRQSELVSTGNEALDEQEEQPMSTTVVDNGALAHVEQSPEAVSETTPESSPRVDLGDLLRDAEPDSTLDASPRPVDLGDLLLDSETTTEQEEIELAPAVTLEEDVPTVQTVPESQTTEVEDARRDEPVADEDVSSNTQEVRSVVVEPTPETLVESESESLKVGEQSGEVGHVRGDEPVMDEDVLVSVSDVPPFVVDSMQEKLIETEVEPPKPEEESIELEQGGPDEPVMIVDIPTSIQDNPPPPLSDPTPETLVETTEVETPKPEEESTPGEKTVEEQPSVEEEPTSCEESVLEMELELPKVDGGFSNIEETTHSEEPVVEKASELHEIEGKPVNVEEPAKEEEPANFEEPFSGEEALIKSEGVSTEAGPEVGSPEVDATTTQEGRGALASDDQVAEREPLKADDDKPVETAKVEKASDRGTQSKPAVASSRPKSPPKAAPVTKQTPAKKPTGATRPTSPTKAPTSAPAKKDVKASVPRAPASKPAASKAPASAVASAKKPAAKPGTTKAEEQKKPEKTKSAAATRPSSKTSESKMQGAARPTSSSTTGKKPLSSTTAPSAAKVPSKGVKDAGPTKSTPKTTTTKPPSAKPAATKTASSATKPAAAKPTRTQSAKPVDSTDSAALAKKPMARPQSAKPKVTTSTTTVKKTTTTTTKVGAGPVKSQTTTTKTVTQSKSGQPKSSTTTTTTTKTTAKPGTRPASAAVKKAGTTGAKSKTGGQPGTGATGGKSATKCAPKKKAEEPAKEKGMKQEGKTPEPTTTVDKKPTEVVETSTEVVEAVVEPPGEASREDKSNELTPDSAPVDQTTPEVEEASEEIVEQFSVVTHVVTAETTTVIKDGEEQSTTTTEETTFEQSAES